MLKLLLSTDPLQVASDPMYASLPRAWRHSVGELNGSIGLWCSLGAGAEPTTMEAHFNYWRLSTKSRNEALKDFFELGILINNSLRLEGISIFVPIELSKGLISDVGPKFEQTDIAQGIFNTGLQSVIPFFGSTYIDLRDKNADRFCRVHRFASDGGLIPDRELVVERKARGTLVTITKQAIDASTHGLQVGDRLYFRLRFSVESQLNNPFLKRIETKGQNLQPGYDTIEYLDFRLNESRSLPDEIERLRQSDIRAGEAVVNLIAFLTAVPETAELSLSNTAHRKSRLLEAGVWNKYVSNSLPQGMVVYHWKSERDDGKSIDGFSAFIKLSFRTTNWKTIVVYLILAVALGIIVNIASAYMSLVLPGLNTPPSHLKPEIFGPPWPGDKRVR